MNISKCFKFLLWYKKLIQRIKMLPCSNIAFDFFNFSIDGHIVSASQPFQALRGRIFVASEDEPSRTLRYEGHHEYEKNGQ